ncbi:serine/threonine-protein kinase [Rudaeicoccus suwonensis]|uniref:non-specific serine/threonine protein kinase n=1 Tax=Rudaeicoccus suwonensis TaxID=657409 RepID=A0A561EBV6_9MICO|nr:serine/threonine-protein kinase [Rudaeicoccus suwonensis]TWE13093.1 serine/threonine protein kinase [Rudaeicoccus suwonensis]
MDHDGTVESAIPHLPGYEVLTPIGQGATGEVWAVRSRDGVRLAAKIVAAESEQLDYEVSVLQAIRHDHVVRLLDVVLDTSVQPPRTALVMDLAEGGSLAQTLARRGVLTPGELVTVLCPVARALHDLHGMGLVHGDLSPGNILLTDQGKPLIADLGMSRLAGHSGEEVWATEAWAAPEVLAGTAPLPASDVYSLGAIAWAALTGAAPEPAALRSDLAELAPEASPEIRDLVNSALSHTDSARPLAGEFALALWECADPEPAPVQGSPGRRAASALAQEDPASALTRRIRTDAAREGTPERRSARAVRASSRRTLRPVMLTVAGVIVVGAAALSMTLAGGSGRAATNAPVPASSAQLPARSSATTSSKQPTAPGRATGTGTSSGSGPARSSSASQPARSAGGGPTSAEALGSQTVRVVQSLVSARAAAWTARDASALGAALVPGSTAYTADAADLASAAEAGATYSGLSFVVRSAVVQQGSGATVHVDAVITQPEFTVVTATGRRTVASTPPVHTDLSLQWTSGGWRIATWGAAR